MTVILVLLTFATFLLIDHFYSRKHTVQPALQVAHVKGEGLPRIQPSMVGGFQVPDNLRYHPGHTWALSESPSLVRVGMDDFASKLTGRVERITLPQRGQWIRQGQKICTLHRDGTGWTWSRQLRAALPTSTKVWHKIRNVPCAIPMERA